MASMSYPQVMQGLQLQSHEIGTPHDQPHPSNHNSTSTITKFYHEINKHPTVNTGTTISSHNQFNHNDNHSIRSLSNTIEII